MTTMGKRIIGARLAAGYDNAANFARQCELSKQYLKNLESGLSKAPNPAHLVKIARALNVSMEWLVTGTGSAGRTVPEATTPAGGDLFKAYMALSRSEQDELLDTIVAFNKLRRP